VKEDEVDRDRRRQSAEKLKSAKDSAKKGEKRRTSTAKHWMRVELNPGRGGSLRKNPPARMMTTTRTAMILRGWRLALTGSSRVRFEATSSSLGQKLQRRVRADLTALGPTPPPRPWLVRSHRALPQRSGGGHAKPQATGPLTRGRAAAFEKGEAGRRSASPGARQAEVAAPRSAPVLEGPGALTRGGSRPTGRGVGGKLFSSWGKPLRRCDICFPIPLHLLTRRSFYAHPFLFFRLKRSLEEAQPSMAKRLKAGAVSKEPGLQLTSSLLTFLRQLLW